MLFRFPHVEVLEAAIEQWYVTSKPDVRRDHLLVDVEVDTTWTPAGRHQQRYVVLAVDDLNEPEGITTYLHILMRGDGEGEWELRSMSYEHDEVIKSVKIRR